MRCQRSTFLFRSNKLGLGRLSPHRGRIGIDGHGLALKLPQICPTKSDRILEHSQSCANVVFRRPRDTGLDHDCARQTAQLIQPAGAPA